MQALYQKQGRSAQFSSVAERDKWLDEKVRKLQEAQNKTGATRRAIQSATASLNSELMELSQVRAHRVCRRRMSFPTTNSFIVCWTSVACAQPTEKN